MARARRILFATLSLPFPPTSGHRLRTWALVRALAADGHRITMVSFAEPGEVVAPHLGALCEEVELVPLPWAGNGHASEPLRRLAALPSPLPYGVRRFQSPAFTACLRRALAREPFDAIVCDGVYNWQNLPPRWPAPVLLNKDDIAHVIVRRYLRLERNPARRLYAALEAAKLRRWERRACGSATATLVSSEADRATLAALCPGAALIVVPNVVDTNHYRPAGDGEPSTVLFQGGMDWPPNRDAVDFFVAEILPELRRRVRSVRFRVAGRSPSEPWRRRFTRVPGLEFTGTVPDIRPEIARATVCVVPLRIGSGTRLKILEAAAMAKPIVSTTLGAEGLHFTQGREILLADTPAAFAETVAGLLLAQGQRRALGQAARRRVELEYDMPALRTALRGVLEAVA